MWKDPLLTDADAAIPFRSVMIDLCTRSVITEVCNASPAGGGEPATAGAPTPAGVTAAAPAPVPAPAGAPSAAAPKKKKAAAGSGTASAKSKRAKSAPAPPKARKGAPSNEFIPSVKFEQSQHAHRTTLPNGSVQPGVQVAYFFDDRNEWHIGTVLRYSNSIWADVDFVDGKLWLKVSEYERGNRWVVLAPSPPANGGKDGSDDSANGDERQPTDEPTV